MLIVGDTLTPRAMFGRGFNDIEPYMTLYKDGIPVAMVANVNHRSPDDCRVADLKSRFQGTEWSVYPGSCIANKNCPQWKTRWRFFAVIYREGTDTTEFRRITIDE